MWQNFYEEDGLMRPPAEQKSNNLGASDSWNQVGWCWYVKEDFDRIGCDTSIN